MTVVAVGPVGKIIREKREARCLSQLELAKKVGLDRSTISDIERGECGPGIKKIAIIAQVLGLSPQDITRAISSAREKKLSPQRARWNCSGCGQLLHSVKEVEDHGLKCSRPGDEATRRVLTRRIGVNVN